MYLEDNFQEIGVDKDFLISDWILNQNCASVWESVWTVWSAPHGLKIIHNTKFLYLTKMGVFMCWNLEDGYILAS